VAHLPLSIAVGAYDRVLPLTDGSVAIDGVDPVFLHLEPEEIFFRAFRDRVFDVCELSLSSSVVKCAEGTWDYVGVPVFPSRGFRHTAIYIRTDRGIETPRDLAGRRVGIPEYQLTANVWVRALLEDEYGLDPASIRWVQGGQEEPGRVEKVGIALRPDIVIEPAPEGATLSAMLAAGEIDAIIAPRPPSCFERGAPRVGWLFRSPAAEAADWYRKTRIFPIMHLLGIHKTLVELHPWLPGALLKAFTRAKDIAVRRLSDNSAVKVTLPFLEERVTEAKALMGDDYWPYGLEENRHVLDFFLDHHHRQGLSSRRVKPEELFHPSVYTSFRI